MKQDAMGRSGPDYALCRYGLSRMTFRGPQKRLTEKYVAFLGSTETFGKFLDQPFPDRVEERLGVTAVNFGAVNAGVDLYARDQTIMAACHDAAATVIQVAGVQNNTNRFYSVHPRRNDRFLRPSAALETLYPDIDFANFAFTRHLLLALEQKSDDRFQLVRSELQDHWVDRMRSFLRHVAGPKVLLWFAEHAPPLHTVGQDVMHADPLFVSRDMIDAVRASVDDVAIVVPDLCPPSERCASLHYHPMEQTAAEAMLGGPAHDEAALAVSAVLAPLLHSGA